jgi:hypothetical protein
MKTLTKKFRSQKANGIEIVVLEYELQTIRESESEKNQTKRTNSSETTPHIGIK